VITIAAVPQSSLFSMEAEDPTTQALESRLESMEAEIVRLVKLASESQDSCQQEQYWVFAKDLQTEAREIRSTLKSIDPSSESAASGRFIPSG